MTQHHGQIVEKIVRKKGANINNLAKKLGVNRRSIYNWFYSPNLKPDTIYKIGLAINYDFTNEFSTVFHDYRFDNKMQDNRDLSDNSGQIVDPDIDYKDKYISLLEKYNQLIKNELQDKQSSDLKNIINKKNRQ